MSKDNTNSFKGAYRKYGIFGGGSGLLSCTCVVIPLVLISISASLASFVMSILGSFGVFFIVFGTIIFVSMLTFDLKRKKAFSFEGINQLKGQIIFSALIFVVLTSILVLAVAPILMEELSKNM